MTKQTVLVVDDDNTIIEVVEALLDKNGYAVLSASNGQEGLDIANDKTPDAIVLDIKMPEMEGSEVLKHLKENTETQDIPVLMLTGEMAISNVSECLEMGAMDYIVKPFDHENFLTRLKHIMRKTG